MGEMGGQIRCGCPMRNEGDPLRQECERAVAGGLLHVRSLDGLPCEQVAPTMFLSRAGKCVLCNPSESVCSEGF
jgi:hypothetical protein